MADEIEDPQPPGARESEARFTAASDRCPRPADWTSTDCGSTEVEVSDLLAGLIRGLQPELVIETGSAWGQTAELIGRALASNGHGRCVSLEHVRHRADYSRKRCEGLPVEVIEGSSLEYVPTEWIDLLFLDSSYENRVPEFELFRRRMRPGAIACFHDTAPGHGSEDLGGMDLRTVVESISNVRVIHLPTPRGISIVELLGNATAAPIPVAMPSDPAPIEDPGPEVPGSSAVVMPSGHTLRVLKHRVGRNSKDFSHWEAGYIKMLMRVVRPGMTVWDVGAEEGEFGALVAKVVGGSHMHLFEPSPRAWPNIRAVWEANGLEMPWCFAGFAAPVSRPCDVAPIGTGWPLEADGPLQLEGAFSVLVERPDLPAISLDLYRQSTGQNPDVVMIDVEGAETVVLDGMKETLDEARPLVFVSIHPPSFISRFEPDREEAWAPQQEHVFRAFSKAGYIGLWLSHDHEAHWLFVHASRQDELFEALHS